MTRSALLKIARAANRPDIATLIEGLDADPVVTEVAHAVHPTVLHGWQSYTNQSVSIERWDLPRPVWLVTMGSGGLAGGEGWAYEDLVLTEYDVTNEPIANAVMEVLHWETRFTGDWAATNTGYRLQPELAYRVPQLRDELAQRMHNWVDAVTTLRALDPQPAPPPKIGGREL